MGFQSWAIVLAGGHGERLKSSTEDWFGYPYPKQFCAFCGNRSMLEHTIHRAAMVVGEERIVTVVNKEHVRFLKSDLPGIILEQPEGKGTGTAVLVAAAFIKGLDNDAVATVLPSDHFIYPESRFIDRLRLALDSAHNSKDQVILMGARPTGAESDYGWIQTGNSLVTAAERHDISLWEATGFYEKPSPERCLELFQSGGCYWNTMIVTARLSTLWLLTSMCVSSLSQRLTELPGEIRKYGREAMEERQLKQLLFSLYRKLPTIDFSRDILTDITDRILVSSFQDMYWSDWGRPERIIDTIERFGLNANFPKEYRLLENV